MLYGKLDITLIDGQIKRSEIACESVISNEPVPVCRNDHPFVGKKASNSAEFP